MLSRNEQSWLALLTGHLQEIAASKSPSKALNALLQTLCGQFAADYCAILSCEQGRAVVLVESDASSTDHGDTGRSLPCWPEAHEFTAIDPIVHVVDRNELLLLLDHESTSDAPLALFVRGIDSVDADTRADLRSAGALIQLARARIAEYDRMQLRLTLAEEVDAGSIPNAGRTQTQDAGALHNAVERLTAAQALSVELIDDLLSAPHAQLDAAISRALARMGQFCGSDRTYLFREVSETTISNTHEWCAPGIEPMAELLQDQPLEIAEQWYTAFGNQPEIYIADVSELPEGDEIRTVLEMQEIQSLLAVPLQYQGRVFGFVGYDAVRQKRSFLKGEISLIRSVANVMATTLAKRDVDQRLSRVRAAQELEHQRLQATLNVIPDILLEIDGDMNIISFHANPSVERQVDLAALVGQSLVKHFPTEIAQVVEQIQSDLQDQDVVDGYAITYSAADQTRRYAVSAARVTERGNDNTSRYIAILRDVTEAHQQRQNIERLSRIAQTTTNLVVVTDSAARIEWVNPAFEARTGYQLDEIIGRRPGDFLQDAETDKSVIAQIRKALDRLQPITCEVLNVSRMGAKYWVRMTIQPLHDEHGTHIGFMAVQTDVTATRELMQEMRNALSSEQRARIQLRSAVDNMQEALIMFDANQRIVICNEKYRALYPAVAHMLVPGADRETLLREGLRKGIFRTKGIEPEEWVRHHLRAFHIGHSQYKMCQIVGRWFRETQQPTPDGGRLCLMSDVTEWKDAEQRAIADRARAMDASRDGIILITENENISYANPSAVSILGGNSADELLGRDWRGLLLGADAVARSELIHASLDESGFWQGEAHPGFDSTDLATLDISATRNTDGGILCIFRDITERRNNEAERETLREQLTLARRREEIGQIAAGLTHDFNNLLAVISGATQMIQEADELSFAQAMATRIAGASEQAAEMLRRMLSLGKNNQVRKLFDLRGPLRDAEALVRPRLRAPITLSVDLPDQPVMTWADSTAVVQMVMNLIINAHDALKSQSVRTEIGRISLSLVLADRQHLATTCDIGGIDPTLTYAIITVTDNGPGMCSDVRENIFTPYFSTKGADGTGLGVPIVVNAVQDQGGGLNLFSEQGAGTKFTIFWPLNEDHADSFHKTETIPRHGLWDGKTVLLYSHDDDRYSQVVAQLEAEGALCVRASTLSELFALADHEDSWDCIVLDLLEDWKRPKLQVDLAGLEQISTTVVAICQIEDQTRLPAFCIPCTMQPSETEFAQRLHDKLLFADGRVVG